MDGNKPYIDFSEGGITLQEFRPGKFVVIAKGKILRAATETEVKLYELHKFAHRVDADTIAVGLAIGAVSAALATSETPIVLRIFAVFAFLFAYWGSAHLFSVYMFVKTPEMTYEILLKHASNIYGLDAWFWLFKRWGLFLTQNMTTLRSIEFGYLSLFCSIALLGGALGIWIAFSLLSDWVKP